jgi:hypothetical protein
MNMKNECYSCAHKEEVPGNCHIKCNNPDPAMCGNEHGIKKGWFIYPFLFDPVWKEVACSNFAEKVSAVSDSVSRAA